MNLVNRIKHMFLFVLLIIVSIALVSCKDKENEGNNEHTHEYVNGSCSCGEKEPHTHAYVDGVCSCGELEPHTHNYVNGKCNCGEINDDYSVLSNFEVITENPVIEDKVEFALYESTKDYIVNNYNPYDYSQINVYAEITDANNETKKVYGFWYRDYEITINTAYTNITGVSGTPSRDPNEIQGLEQVKWSSEDYHFRFRFTPTVAGTHKVKVVVEEQGKIVQTIDNTINVSDNTDSNYKGIIGIDKTNNRHFIDGNGDTFIVNGLNLCWWSNGSRKTYDYDVWFDYSEKNNINFARIWMATWGFCQHWQTIDNFDKSQNNAARLDKVIELADDHNLYIQLCLLNHGQFSTQTNSEWAKNPYNEENGGMLKSPAQFFNNEEAKQAYKMELRYLIARYGYSDKLLAWELFNEVDWTDGAEGYNMMNIKNWHQEMAKFIKENDSYNHLITTSYKYMNLNSNLAYKLEDIDFISVHSYEFSGKNVNKKLPSDLQAVMTKYNKPVHAGEIGIDWQSGQTCNSLDPNGVSIRQALWAGMMCGSPGGAMQWWWESWIHPNKLYYLYNGSGIYASKLDLTGEDYALLSSEHYSLSSDEASLLGYHFDDRVYGYLFNNSWSYTSSNPGDISSLNVSVNINDGTYGLTYYNTVTGEVISTSTIVVTNGNCTINVPTFNEDIAFIIE